jgi:hypothetical protein
VEVEVVVVVVVVVVESAENSVRGSGPAQSAETAALRGGERGGAAVVGSDPKLGVVRVFTILATAAATSARSTLLRQLNWLDVVAATRTPPNTSPHILMSGGGLLLAVLRSRLSAPTASAARLSPACRSRLACSPFRCAEGAWRRECAPAGSTRESAEWCSVDAR